MTTEERAIAILERANPVPLSVDVDPPTSAPRYLEDIQQRSSTVSIESTELESTRRRWLMLGAAAAVIGVVIAAAAFIVGGDNDQIEIDTPESIPSTSASVTTSTIAASPELDPGADAQAAVDAFVLAYNAGDGDSLFGLLAPDVVPTEVFGGAPDPSAEPEDQAEWEQVIAWRTAGGWAIEDVTCAPASAQPVEGYTLSCQYATASDVMQAVDAESTPTAALVTVVDGSITELHVSYGEPAFGSVSDPFGGWMSTYHPDVAGAGLFAWTDREEAAEHGRIRAGWAQEWAAWLETYGCDPTGPCIISIEQWVDEYDQACTESALGSSVSRDLIEAMRLVPVAATQAGARRTLIDADEALLDPDLTGDRVAELQQQRLDAMIELGIDERCHPVIE